MQIEILFVAISVIFITPVWILSYFQVVFLVYALRYPKQPVEHQSGNKPPKEFFQVSILIAVFNEKYVIGRTLDAIRHLNYPLNKIQVVIADDSTDETCSIVDQKISELERSGISSLVSRRATRDGFKSGALNHAAKLLNGDYILLLDADSVVTRDVLSNGIEAFESHQDISFVSYRVEHYNREQNLITRLFALSLDVGDTIIKMGAYHIGAPFSFQGGFTMISKEALFQAGFWSNDSIVDDADLSYKLYSAGKKGIYLKDTPIFSEDPSCLEVWKRQSARISQGWAKCVSKYWSEILTNDWLPIWKKIALLITFITPFSSLSWLVVTFLSATTLFAGSATPSVFSNPFYVLLTTIPIASFFFACAYSLKLRGILNLRNLTLIPLLLYTANCMFTANSIGFIDGIRGKSGFYTRTPKSGVPYRDLPAEYSDELKMDGIFVAEGVLSIVAIFLGIYAAIGGVAFLSISLIGFGTLTIKSMNIRRLFLKPKRSDGSQIELETRLTR